MKMIWKKKLGEMREGIGGWDRRKEGRGGEEDGRRESREIMIDGREEER